mmetsp:Transcript_12812/g.40905  ORF Transcript_12812/g.40905 Transcript_12812/m.40905 type:complete len:251 (+) Transcript_12812:416-1168(+)
MLHRRQDRSSPVHASTASWSLALGRSVRNLAVASSRWCLQKKPRVRLHEVLIGMAVAVAAAQVQAGWAVALPSAARILQGTCSGCNAHSCPIPALQATWTRSTRASVVEMRANTSRWTRQGRQRRRGPGPHRLTLGRTSTGLVSPPHTFDPRGHLCMPRATGRALVVMTLRAIATRVHQARTKPSTSGPPQERVMCCQRSGLRRGRLRISNHRQADSAGRGDSCVIHPYPRPSSCEATRRACQTLKFPTT